MKVLAYQVRPDEKEHMVEFAAKYGHDVTMIDEDFGPDTAHLAEGYQGISILGNSLANRQALEAVAKLGIKYISSRVAGTDNVDTAACREFGLKASHVPAYSPNSVSEYTVGMAINLTRKLNLAIRRAERQNFSLGGLLGTEIRNKTVGVVGAGRIGLHVIKAFSGFGGRIIAYDVVKNPEVEEYATYTSLDELYEQADIITLHTPLFDENYHMIDAQAISQMKPGVIIINAARGGLIDTEALIAGVKAGQVGGAAIDVYEDEQGIFHFDHDGRALQDDKLSLLLQLPNVLVTPHCAFYTDQAVSNMVETAMANLKDYELTGVCKNEIK